VGKQLGVHELGVLHQVSMEHAMDLLQIVQLVALEFGHAGTILPFL
jgi:hypothetical protein